MVIWSWPDGRGSRMGPMPFRARALAAMMAMRDGRAVVMGFWLTFPAGPFLSPEPGRGGWPAMTSM